MASSHSKTSSPEPGFDLDLKGETFPRTTTPDEDGLSSGNSSLAEDRAFLRVPGEETYVPIDKYEGRHRWDPQFQWEPIEEKRLVRKIDLKICTWVCLTFFALQLDQDNIAQALTDNMLPDLGLTTNDYNYGQTIFYLCFLSAELPSQLISKKLGPDRWIPIQMVSWSLVASFQAFISGRSSFYACRALLGLIEGGVSYSQDRTTFQQGSQLTFYILVYPRHHFVPLVLVQGQGIARTTRVVLDLVPSHQYCRCFSGRRLLIPVAM